MTPTPKLWNPACLSLADGDPAHHQERKKGHVEDLLSGWVLKIKQWTNICVLFGQSERSLHYEDNGSH